MITSGVAEFRSCIGFCVLNVELVLFCYEMFWHAISGVFFSLFVSFPAFADVRPGDPGISKSCPPGEHWVKAHYQKAYTRSDGTAVSGSIHKAGCRRNPESFLTWNDRLKSGMPPLWELKQEKSKAWAEDEKENVLEAITVLPSFLLIEAVDGIYRLKTSGLLRDNVAANFRNQIALYDKAFGQKQNLARILAHEFSHIYFQGLSRKEQLDYAIAAEWEAALWNGLRDKELTLVRNGFVEADSQNSPEEDFANNIEYYLFDTTTLRRKSPKVYNWISKKFGDTLKLRIVR